MLCIKKGGNYMFYLTVRDQAEEDFLNEQLKEVYIQMLCCGFNIDRDNAAYLLESGKVKGETSLTVHCLDLSMPSALTEEIGVECIS